MKSLILTVALTSAVFASSFNKSDVAPVTNELYKKECGSCHFAYQPGLLPSKAWNKMMLNLSNHFGSDASLEEEDYLSISRYLNNNSAEKFMNYKRSAKIVDSLRAGEIPESISKTPYIIKKHRDIKASLITQKEVKGIFNCTACHTTAQKWIYGESDVLIPNYGKWKD
ncbi:diheme cytochrome c [Sulfurimonas sp.]|uniref:diheme cytochrome c n=1 Tax=Sulfurimonas sp. TaxID=2022749 RepID=UPI0025CDFD2F|nr:diheme cytochrome c [Sulfurimonas sp.]MDD5158266.1 diheme cytochrome c [Sulfurimonas sp.]